MRLRDITKNLTDYEDERLIEIFENGRIYRMDRGFYGKLPSAFIGQAFGGGSEYNRILANAMKDAREYFDHDIPIYTQTEIGEELQRLRGFWKPGGLTCIGETYGEGEEASSTLSKVDSFHILGEIKKIMDSEGLDPSRVAFFAHPGHIYRVMEIGRMQGLEGGAFIKGEVDWPENDVQPWVRDADSWKGREWKGRVHHAMKKYVPREGSLKLMNIVPQFLWNTAANLAAGQ